MSNAKDAVEFVFEKTDPVKDEEMFARIFEAEEKRIRGHGEDAKALIKELSAVPVKEEEKAVVAEVVPPVENGAAQEVQAVKEVKDDPSTPIEEKAVASTVTPSENATTNAWLDSLTPEVRGEVDKILAEKAQLEELKRRQGNQVAAYQRHYHEAQNKLAALEKAAPVKTPQVTPAAKPSNDPRQNPQLKAIREVDEVLGDALIEMQESAQRREEALKAEIEALKQEHIEPVRQRQDQAYMEHELERLEKMVPGMKEVLAHPIWDDFVQHAPQMIQQLANSPNAEDVALVAQDYIDWINRADVKEWANKKYGAPAQQQQTQTQVVQKQTDPAAAQKAQNFQQEAARKAQTSAVVQSHTARPNHAQPTMEQIMADPALQKKFHEDVYEEELIRLGLKPAPKK